MPYRLGGQVSDRTSSQSAAVVHVTINVINIIKEFVYIWVGVQHNWPLKVGNATRALGEILMTKVALGFTSF